MELKKTNLKFTMYGELAGLTRADKGYGMRTGTTRNGQEYKATRFDVIIDKKSSYKIPCDIFGSVRDEIYYKDRAANKSKKAAWEDRFALAEDENNYVYPQPYDAAVNVEMASDGDVFRLYGDITPDTFEKDGKTYTAYKFCPVEATEVATKEEIEKGTDKFIPNYGCALSGDFIFAEVSGGNIEGFVVNYKKEVFPITFKWGGDADVLKDIKEAIQFGTLCNITNGKAEMIAVGGASGKKSFGTAAKESVSANSLRVGFVLYGLDIARETPYTAKDLGIYDDDDEELFK